eukprot:4368547-Lingulodinium_polyedra.AAC.1
MLVTESSNPPPEAPESLLQRVPAGSLAGASPLALSETSQFRGLPTALTYSAVPPVVLSVVAA